MIEADRARPLTCAQEPGAGREPGTTTAPSGTVERASARRRGARARARGRRSTLEPVRITPGREDGPRPDADPLVETDAAADEDLVLDDDRQGADRLEDAADLGRGREVDALPDLRARTDEGVAVDHRPLVDVGADVDVRRRHHDDARRDVGAAPDRRVPRVRRARPRGRAAARRKRVAVAEPEGSRGHVRVDAEAERAEDALLHAGFDAPAVAVGLGRAQLAALERVEERRRPPPARARALTAPPRPGSPRRRGARPPSAPPPSACAAPSRAARAGGGGRPGSARGGGAPTSPGSGSTRGSSPS